jgi:hypothetical protein
METVDGPKFSVGDLIGVKPGIYRLKYYGDPSEFKTARVARATGYPRFDPEDKVWIYSINTEIYSGYHIAESDFDFLENNFSRTTKYISGVDPIRPALECTESKGKDLEIKTMPKFEL